MAETFENTPINELSIEGLERAIENMRRKYEDALIDIEGYPDAEHQEKAIEDAVQFNEAIIEMTKMKGLRKREAIVRMNEGNEINNRFDDPEFPGNEQK